MFVSLAGHCRRSMLRIHQLPFIGTAVNGRSLETNVFLGGRSLEVDDEENCRV